MAANTDHYVDLARLFVQIPSFALAFGAFAKLYEDEDSVSELRMVILTNLLEYCKVLKNYSKDVSTILRKKSAETNETLTQILTCTYCKSLFFHPVVLSCGHTFCRTCIDEQIVCHSCTATTASMDKNECCILVKAVHLMYPDTPTYHCYLDRVLHLKNTGNYHEAVELCNEALETDASDVRTLNMKAHLYFLMGEYDQCLSVAYMALSSEVPDAKLYCLSARVLIRLGRFREAMEYFFKCHVVYPYPKCLKRELHYIMLTQFTEADVTMWKRIVDECFMTVDNIETVILDLPDNFKPFVPITPWMTDSQKPSAQGAMPRLPKFVCNFSSTEEVRRSLHDDFKCALCLRLFLYPLTATCGHSFCYECLEKSMDYRPNCPLCQCSLTHYLACTTRSVNKNLWSLTKYLYPQDVAERKETWLQERLAFSRVGHDPSLEVPVMSCCLAFPGLPCPLHIYESHFRSMVRRAMLSGSRRFALFSPGTSVAGLSEIGILLQIKNCDHLPNGRLLIDTRGLFRIRALSSRVVDGCINIRYELYTDNPVPADREAEYASKCRSVHALASQWINQLSPDTRSSLLNFYGGLPRLNDDWASKEESNGSPVWIWWLVAALPLTDACRSRLLIYQCPEMRLKAVHEILLLLVADPSQQAVASTC